MSFRLRTIFVWLWALVSFSPLTFSQEASIELGKKDVTLDEPFVIILTIRNAQVKNIHSAFPDIDGMQKREVALVNTKEEINGKSVIIQRITQNYLAQKAGTYLLKPFRMTVNGKEISAPGLTLQVQSSANEKDKSGVRLADKLYEEILGMEKEISEVKEDAFLAFSTDKDTVFTGQGFTATLALYVAESNQVEMKSFEEGAQLVEMLKQLKPASCWEQNYRIREFQTSAVTLNQKRYTQYTMYRAGFFPFNADTIRFPEVSFRMIRYRTSKDLQTGRSIPRVDTVQFFSKPRTLFVKELPPHPAREGMAVGEFSLKEAISRHKLQTGESFVYECRIEGEGNFAAVDIQTPASSQIFDFYPPEIRLEQERWHLRGSKAFRFITVPKEPGTYPLQSYFAWIYFNTRQQRYDTLQPRMIVQISGESYQNRRLASGDLTGIYRGLAAESNQLRPVDLRESIRTLVNGVLLTMLFTTMLLMMLKR